MKKIIFLLSLACLIIPGILFAGELDPNSYAEKFPTIPQNARIALLPMAYDFPAVPQEIPVIQDAIISQIQALGLTPLKVKLDSSSMPKGIDRLFLLPNLANKEIRPAKQNFLLDLKNQAAFDVVLIPAVVSRAAKLSGQMAKWDNVKARLEIKGYGSGMNSEWSGSRLGLSLEIDAYDAEGNWLFTSYGGISLPYIINTKDSMNDLKPRLFESEKDQETLQKGVEAALKPLTKKVKIAKN